MPHQIFSWLAGRCAIPLDQAWFCESSRVVCNDATCCNCASPEHTQCLAKCGMDHARYPGCWLLIQDQLSGRYSAFMLWGGRHAMHGLQTGNQRESDALVIN